MTTETKKYPEIVNMAAFNAGYGAFFNGSRKPYLISDKRVEEIKNLKNGKTTAALVKWYAERGLILTLTTDGEGFRMEQVTQPECPYKPHTYAAKEWQRGFNAAYNKNSERNKNARHSHARSDHRGRPDQRRTTVSGRKSK